MFINSSSDPYSVNHFTAVFGPHLGTPGMLSTLSPTSFDIFLVFAFVAAVIGGLDSLVGAVAFGIGTGLVIALVSGYSDSSNAPLVALVLLVLNLLFKPEGVFSHHKARAV